MLSKVGNTSEEFEISKLRRITKKDASVYAGKQQEQSCSSPGALVCCCSTLCNLGFSCRTYT